LGRHTVGSGAEGPPGANRSVSSRRPSAGLNAAVALRGLFQLGLVLACLGTPIVLRNATLTAPTLRAALEMMTTLFALAGAWLLRAQFASRRRMRDLLLLVATLTLGLVNFGAAALPAALNLGAATYFAAAQLWGELLVGGMFALAAVASSDWLVARRGYPLAIVGGLGSVGLAVAGLGGLLVGAQNTARPLAAAIGHPLLLGLVVAATGLFIYAAVGFARRYEIEDDRASGLVALATGLMAGAVFSDLLAGALAPGGIAPSEGLRVIAFALILAAAVIAERRVHARISKASALAERRRVARDLHDGIAQDLAFIAAHGPRFAEQLGEEHPVVVAAKRALAISRSTISELSDPDGATAHESLEAVAQELRERFDIAIAVNAELDRDLASQEREHVTRIAREAIANAARHGGARNVIVSLRHTDTGIALRVIDDGCGIAGAHPVPAPEGFGLTSMRERAAALGGQLNVRQPRLGGTELEVVLP